jgi:hypothetical protein
VKQSFTFHKVLFIFVLKNVYSVSNEKFAKISRKLSLLKEKAFQIFHLLENLVHCCENSKDERSLSRLSGKLNTVFKVYSVLGVKQDTSLNVNIKTFDRLDF